MERRVRLGQALEAGLRDVVVVDVVGQRDRLVRDGARRRGLGRGRSLSPRRRRRRLGCTAESPLQAAIASAAKMVRTPSRVLAEWRMLAPPPRIAYAAGRQTARNAFRRVRAASMGPGRSANLAVLDQFLDAFALRWRSARSATRARACAAPAGDDGGTRADSPRTRHGTASRSRRDRASPRPHRSRPRLIRPGQHDCRALRAESRQVVDGRQPQALRECPREVRRADIRLRLNSERVHGNAMSCSINVIAAAAAGRGRPPCIGSSRSWDAVATTSSASRRCASWPVLRPRIGAVFAYRLERREDVGKAPVIQPNRDRRPGRARAR